MTSITKIFHFEMAHAIYDYPGACRNIHGHSYILHVSITNIEGVNGYFPGTGMIFDFKELKRIVNEAVLRKLDHQLVLSEKYVKMNNVSGMENLFEMEAEPTAENLLRLIRKKLEPFFPGNMKLVKLLLYETKDSYAEWINTDMHMARDKKSVFR